MSPDAMRVGTLRGAHFALEGLGERFVGCGSRVAVRGLKAALGGASRRRVLKHAG